jgi:AcrR family transcriptional regulator
MSALRADDMARSAGRPDLGAPAPFNDVDEDSLLPARFTADGTLRRMLLSALVLFAERGYHAVPVREIARGAGIRASSMYEHRASKEKLLLDLMLIGHEEHRAWLTEALAAAGDDPCRQIDAVIRAHVRVHATYPMLTRVCNRELGSLNDDSLATVLEVRRGAERVLTTTIDRGVDAGVFDVRDSYLATAAIGAMGIRVAEWYRPNSDLSVDAVADAYALFGLRLLGATAD